MPAAHLSRSARSSARSRGRAARVPRPAPLRTCDLAPPSENLRETTRAAVIFPSARCCCSELLIAHLDHGGDGGARCRHAAGGALADRGGASRPSRARSRQGRRGLAAPAIGTQAPSRSSTSRSTIVHAIAMAAAPSARRLRRPLPPLRGRELETSRLHQPAARTKRDDAARPEPSRRRPVPA